MIRRKNDNKWIKIGVGGGDTQYVTDASLADCGVIAYENGLWNPTNWLENMEDDIK